MTRQATTRTNGASAPSGNPVVALGLTYGQGLSNAETNSIQAFDVYSHELLPGFRGRPSPIAVLIPGGAYRTIDTTTITAAIIAFLQSAGFTCIVLYYRVAGGAGQHYCTINDSESDVALFFTQLIHNALPTITLTDYGADNKRIIAIGGSAGGGMCLRMWALYPDIAARVKLFYAMSVDSKWDLGLAGTGPGLGPPYEPFSDCTNGIPNPFVSRTKMDSAGRSLDWYVHSPYTYVGSQLSLVERIRANRSVTRLVMASDPADPNLNYYNGWWMDAALTSLGLAHDFESPTTTAGHGWSMFPDLYADFLTRVKTWVPPNRLAAVGRSTVTRKAA